MENRRIGSDAGAPEPTRPASAGKARPRTVELGGAGTPARASEPGAAPSGAAFQVLLERLSRQARELQESAEAVERPDDLAGAVGRARASLSDALSLSDRLLEAWRAERLNPKAPEETQR